MKRVGYLFDQIINKDNIRRAVLNASKNKTKKYPVKRALQNFETTVDNIYNLLSTKTYTPSHYFKDVIEDGISHKKRVIFKPRFNPDQIIHWALAQIIQPLLARGMYVYSCASIPKRGVHYAQRALERWLRNDIKNSKYCLKMDVRQFYPSINKDILKKKFRKVIKDESALWLIDKILDSHSQGLPIGNYTSQWFANFYLQELDHFIKEHLKINYYVRYMDDLVLMGPNKRKLHKARKEIDEFLKKEGLEMKNNWQVFPIEARPIDFVGYVFSHTETHIRKSLSLRIIRKERKTKKRMNAHNASAMISYFGWVKHSTAFNFFKSHFTSIKQQHLKEAIRHANAVNN